MNRKEHLLNLLMEEACEIAQAANKCVRFTPEHAHYAESNLDRLKIEIGDLASVIQMLNAEFGFGISLEANEAKIVRIEKYMQISREMGTLNE